MNATLTRVECGNDRCPGFRHGHRQVIGEVDGMFRLKCPRCRQYTEGRS